MQKMSLVLFALLFIGSLYAITLPGDFALSSPGCKGLDSREAEKESNKAKQKSGNPDSKKFDSKYCIPFKTKLESCISSLNEGQKKDKKFSDFMYDTKLVCVDSDPEFRRFHSTKLKKAPTEQKCTELLEGDEYKAISARLFPRNYLLETKSYFAYLCVKKFEKSSPAKNPKAALAGSKSCPKPDREKLRDLVTSLREQVQKQETPQDPGKLVQESIKQGVDRAAKKLSAVISHMNDKKDDNAFLKANPQQSALLSSLLKFMQAPEAATTELERKTLPEIYGMVEAAKTYSESMGDDAFKISSDELYLLKNYSRHANNIVCSTDEANKKKKGYNKSSNQIAAKDLFIKYLEGLKKRFQGRQGLGEADRAAVAESLKTHEAAKANTVNEILASIQKFFTENPGCSLWVKKNPKDSSKLTGISGNWCNMAKFYQSCQPDKDLSSIEAILHFLNANERWNDRRNNDSAGGGTTSGVFQTLLDKNLKPDPFVAPFEIEDIQCSDGADGKKKVTLKSKNLPAAGENGWNIVTGDVKTPISKESAQGNSTGTFEIDLKGGTRFTLQGGEGTPVFPIFVGKDGMCSFDKEVKDAKENPLTCLPEAGGEAIKVEIGRVGMSPKGICLCDQGEKIDAEKKQCLKDTTPVAAADKCKIDGAGDPVSPPTGMKKGVGESCVCQSAELTFNDEKKICEKKSEAKPGECGENAEKKGDKCECKAGFADDKGKCQALANPADLESKKEPEEEDGAAPSSQRGKRSKAQQYTPMPQGQPIVVPPTLHQIMQQNGRAIETGTR